MIEAWAAPRPVRFFLAGSVLACGFVVAVLLLHQNNFTAATAAFAISLAALVGAGKLASPWGFNAATTAVLSSGRGYWLSVILYIAAYVFPGAIVWGILGIVLRPLGGVPLLLPLLALAYALWFGLRETLGLHKRQFGLVWQVPSGWIKGRPAMVKALIWGTTLGPGLVTKNPYAGMWLLPLLIPLNRSLLMTVVVGIAVGAAHGGARALGVLRNQRCLASDASAHLRILNARTQWQYIDGLTLLLAAGALVAYTLTLLAVHL